MATRKTARGKAAKTSPSRLFSGPQPRKRTSKPLAEISKPLAEHKAKSPAKKGAVAKTKVVAKQAPAKKAAVKPAAKGGVEAGSRAPSFTLKDQAGKTIESASLAGAPYVLYFYPKDDTTGCTKEACGFRDSFKGFGKSKARILGVSPDSEASHERFSKKYGLPFTLLSDPDKTLANAYGVWVKKLNYGREYMGILRSTFVVDAKGNIAKAYRGVRVDGHVAAVLEAVQSLA